MDNSPATVLLEANMLHVGNFFWLQESIWKYLLSFVKTFFCFYFYSFVISFVSNQVFCSPIKTYLFWESLALCKENWDIIFAKSPYLVSLNLSNENNNLKYLNSIQLCGRQYPVSDHIQNSFTMQCNAVQEIKMAFSRRVLSIHNMWSIIHNAIKRLI